MHNHLSSPVTFSRRDRATLRRLAVGEDGAAYTLSYVMVIPVYALLICLIIETCLMLTAKLGTVYAAFAAARTASVWSSATTWEKARAKAQKAAIKAMVPFASGTQSALSTVPTTPAGVAGFPRYWLAYQAYAKRPVAHNYLLAKYSYASRHVQVTIAGPPATSDAPITAKVTYRFPFNVPGIGRLIGQRGVGGYYYALTSEVIIPNEGPRDNRKTIGIPYGTFE